MDRDFQGGGYGGGGGGSYEGPQRRTYGRS